MMALDSPRLAVRLGFWLLMFLLLLSLCLVVRAPARLLGEILSRACQERCVLLDAQGDLGEGTGDIHWQATDGLWRRLSRISWSLRWPQFPGSGLGWNLRLEQGKADILIDWGNLGVTLEGAVVPVAVLPAMVPVPLPDEGWLGDLEIMGELHCQWRQQNCDVDADVRWSNARMLMVVPDRLGDYQLKTHGDLRQLRFNWVTLAGPLFIEADGTISRRHSQISGQAWVQGDPELFQKLEPWLRPIGIKDPAAANRYQLGLNSQRGV